MRATALFLLSMMLFAAPLSAAELVSRDTKALQGSCSAERIAQRGNDEGLSTMACPGISADSINLTYADGTEERCVYIDNFSSNQQSYFVPLRTSEEWAKFKQSTVDGTLAGKVRISYGCTESHVMDSCGVAEVDLERDRDGAMHDVEVTPFRSVTYLCDASDNCGRWIVKREEGFCPVDAACGSAAGLTTAAAPTTNLCDTGEASAVTTPAEGGFAWTCAGQYGGEDAVCTSYKMAVKEDVIIPLDNWCLGPRQNQVCTTTFNLVSTIAAYQSYDKLEVFFNIGGTGGAGPALFDAHGDLAGEGLNDVCPYSAENAHCVAYEIVGLSLNRDSGWRSYQGGKNWSGRAEFTAATGNVKISATSGGWGGCAGNYCTGRASNIRVKLYGAIKK